MKPRYGERDAKKATKTRGSDLDKRIEKLSEKVHIKLQGSKLGRRSGDPLDKLRKMPEFVELQKLRDQRDQRRQASRRRQLLKDVPTLAKVRDFLGSADEHNGIELFEKLCEELLETLDDTMEDGQRSVPSSGGGGGSFRTDYDRPGIPAGSFIVTPYAGSPAPGPSGLC